MTTKQAIQAAINITQRATNNPIQSSDPRDEHQHVVSTGDLDDILSALQALAEPSKLDVEQLKRHKPEHMTINDADFYDSSYDDGWNSAIDHIVSKGLLAARTQGDE